MRAISIPFWEVARESLGDLNTISKFGIELGFWYYGFMSVGIW